MRLLSNLVMVVGLGVWSVALHAGEGFVYCGAEQWESIIDEAATRFDLPPSWVRGVIHVESGGCTITELGPIKSKAGAMGLMQLMPNTWSRLTQRLKLGNDPYDPRANVLAGTAYLRELFDRYGTDGFLAAYHAGPHRYEEWVQQGRALPSATRDYLTRVSGIVSQSAGVVAEKLCPDQRAGTVMLAFSIHAVTNAPAPSALSGCRTCPSRDCSVSGAVTPRLLFIHRSASPHSLSSDKKEMKPAALFVALKYTALPGH